MEDQSYLKDQLNQQLVVEKSLPAVKTDKQPTQIEQDKKDVSDQKDQEQKQDAEGLLNQDDQDQAVPASSEHKLPPHLQSIPVVYKWIIVILCSVAQFLTIGAGLNLNMFLEEIRHHFQISYTAVSLISSIALALMQGCGPIAAVILQTFGFKQSVMAAGLIAAIAQFGAAYANTYPLLLLLLGVVYGAAQSVSMVGCATAPGYFIQEKHRHIAISIVFTGMGIAQLVLPLLYDYLIQALTWRGAFVIISGLTLNIIAAGASLPVISEGKISLKERLNLGVWRRPRFIALMFAGALAQMCGVGIQSFFMSILTNQYQLSLKDAAQLLSLLGIPMVIGRISVSFLKASDRVPRWWTFCVVCLCFCLCFLIFGQLTKYTEALGIMLILGFFMGVLYPLHSVVLIDLFPIKQLTSIFGYNYLAFGLGSLAGPPLLGAIKDHTKRYDIATGVVAGICAVPFIIPIICLPIARLIGWKKFELDNTEE